MSIHSFTAIFISASLRRKYEVQFSIVLKQIFLQSKQSLNILWVTVNHYLITTVKREITVNYFCYCFVGTKFHSGLKCRRKIGRERRNVCANVISGSFFLTFYRSNYCLCFMYLCVCVFESLGWRELEALKEKKMTRNEK